MAKVAWRPQARVELKEILKFIARNDGRPQTAAKIDAEIREKLLLYAESPNIGQRYAGLLEGTRYCIHKRWAIFYRPIESGIEVTNVIDTARDFSKLFGTSN